jgi:serine/threonine-protein kinase
MIEELKEGMMVGRYRLMQSLAQGGMGSVWCAHDGRLERDVAVKLLPRILITDPSVERRFEREARAMGRLQHPNVVSVFDFGSARVEGGDELPYLVMELIRGRSLDVLMRDGPLATDRALRIMEQVARALAAAHAAGVVHRDLKPSNVMVDEDDHVKVLDFGLARLNQRDGQTPEETLTTPGMILGSCPYMAPEQALGQQVGPQTDMFSVGSVLYEALSGRRAFDGSTPVRVLQSVVKGSYAPLAEVAPAISEDVADVVGRCLQLEPEQRFSSCAELAATLSRLYRAETSSQISLPALTGPAPGTLASLGVAQRWILAAGAVVMLLAGLGLGLLLG